MRRSVAGCLRWVLFFGLLSFAGNAFSDQPKNAATNSPVELFKRFIESPPIIEKLVFREKKPPAIGKPMPRDTGIRDSTNYVYYEATWQPDAFKMMAVPPNGSRGTNSYYGLSASSIGGDYWTLHGGVAAFWHDPGQNPTNSGPAASNPVKVTYEDLRHTFCQVMNMGVMHLEPGTIRWKGDSFDADFVERGVHIRGELALSSNSFPKTLRVNYGDSTNFATYLTQYEYKGAGAHALPNVIRTYYVRENREPMEWTEFRLLALQTTEREAARSEFDPQRVVTNYGLRFQFYTNDAFYSVGKRGQLERVVDYSIAFARPRRVSPVVYFGCVLGVSAASFGLFIRLKNKDAET